MSLAALFVVLSCAETPVPSAPAQAPPAPPIGDMGSQPDADEDGLSDADEALHGTNAHERDSDGDGKPDGAEVHVYKTDPTKMDSDGDGVADGAEIARGTDPNDPEDWPADIAPALPAEPEGGQAGMALEVCRFDSQDLETCMVRIPAGSFLMGAQATDPAAPGYDARAQPDEGPPHTVEVASFWMQRDEVLVATFVACLESHVCQAGDVRSGGLSTWTQGSTTTSALPITSITWEGAERLCRYLGGRLPTEAEWEYAARGPDSHRFPWGDTPGCGTSANGGFNPDGSRLGGDRMTMGPCVHEGPKPTRDLAGESPFRLRGMAGNVWEWVADGYDAHAYEPGHGTAQGAQRVQRGGGWTSQDPLELRSAARMSMPPDDQVIDVGLRCARDVSPTDAP